MAATIKARQVPTHTHAHARIPSRDAGGARGKDGGAQKGCFVVPIRIMNTI